MRTAESWFSFEHRCLLCGEKFVGGIHGNYGRHLGTHVREGYLTEDYESLKPHPIGFPGPPLGQQPACSNPTSPG